MTILQELEVFHSKNLWFPVQERMPIHTNMFMEKVFWGFLEKLSSVTSLVLFQQTGTMLTCRASLSVSHFLK